MSFDFYGKAADGSMLKTELGPDYFNMSNDNCYRVMAVLGLHTEQQYGEATIPEARRAIIRARATFARVAPQYAQEGSDTKRPGKCRIISHALTQDDIAERIDRFEKFVRAMEERGATLLYWA